MTHPDIWKTCAELGSNINDYDPEVEADCWLMLDVDGENIGVYNVHAHNSTTIEVHAHVLPEFRQKHSHETGDLVLKWILEEGPEQYQKVIAQIPECYPNVIKFTMAHGFKKEGVNRQSDIVDGILCDQILLGITRSEIEEYLNDK